MQQIVIIGNGMAGITCARHIRKSCTDQIQVVSSESQHFFSRTALMYIYMGHMKFEHTKPYEDFFWEKNKIDLIHKKVVSVQTDKKQLLLDDNTLLRYDKLVIATGSVTQKFDWPGQHLRGVCGLYSLQDLEQIELTTQNIKSAVITGGGLIGIELAEMLHSRGIKVTMLVKDSYYWASVLREPEAALVSAQIRNNNISICYNTELKEISGNAAGEVENVVTQDGKKLECQFVGIATGVSPNVAFLKNSGIEVAKGVLVNEFFETSIENIYAIGDCAEFRDPAPGRKKIEQVWYTARMHGETLAKTITGSKSRYLPGPWFNSAKFFDLEYQTYGLTSSKLENDEQYFFWTNPEKNTAFSIVYKADSRSIKGVNSFGMRLRHATLDAWIRQSATVDKVLSNLHEAVFDPEFSKCHIPSIIAAFNEQTGMVLKAPRKKLFFFRNK